jgi:hypothetical protein
MPRHQRRRDRDDCCEHHHHEHHEHDRCHGRPHRRDRCDIERDLRFWNGRVCDFESWILYAEEVIEDLERELND